MNKGVFIFFLCVVILTSGCKSYYEVLKESKATEDIKQYNTISVGWLDLNEEKWKEFEYNNKSEWVSLINFMNKTNMPEYFKDILPEKKITFTSSKNNEPNKEELVIKFTEVEYIQRTNNAAKIIMGESVDSDVLIATIHFIDGRTSKELYQVKAGIKSTAAFGPSEYSFEGRVNNCVYNLIYFISEKLN